MDELFSGYEEELMQFASDDSDSIGSLLEWGSDGLVYEGSLMSSDRAPSEIAEPDEQPITLVPVEEEFTRLSKSHWMQIPTPLEVAYRSQEILSNLTDEELLTISPSLVVHMMRTGAQGGVQTISPRQITLGGMASRVNEATRQPDSLLVGSNATKKLPWPVAAGYILSNLWYREPLDAYPNTPAVRGRTRTSTVVIKGDVRLDPVEMAITKARALVDMQRRPDIGGDAQALMEILAASWGIDPDVLDEVSGTLIEGSGNLLRYAIGPDKHYPVVHAPVQARKVMSVAAMTMGRDAYGEWASIDWRRLRVLAEAVFYMSARTEGYTMEDMAQPRPVGDPSASPNRAGILHLRPNPGAVWCFDPATFRINPSGSVSVAQQLIIPDRVSSILDTHVDAIYSVTRTGVQSHKITYAGASVGNYSSTVAEALVSGYDKVLSIAAAFQAKGYTAEAAVTGFIYQFMEGNVHGGATEAVWITRAVTDVAKELGVRHVVDVRMTKHMAARLTLVSDDLRQKLVVEAEKRGESLDDWWADFASRVPFELRYATEGTGAWAAAITWCLTAQPSARWAKLSAALANVTHASLAQSHFRETKLPARVGSVERVEEACRAALLRLSRSYATYYHAIADAAYLVSARMVRAGDTGTAGMLRVAGRMWDIRAAAVRTLTLSFNAPPEFPAATVRGNEVEGWLSTAPYKAYMSWRDAAKRLKVDLTGYPQQVQGRVSGVFRDKTQPLMDCGTLEGTRVFRYLAEPSRLCEDIERSIAEIAATLDSVVDQFENEGIEEPFVHSSGESVAITGLKVDLSRFKPEVGSFWEVLPTLESHDAIWASETLDELEESDQQRLLAMRYTSGEHLMMEVNAAVLTQQGRTAREAVM